MWICVIRDAWAEKALYIGEQLEILAYMGLGQPIYLHSPVGDGCVEKLTAYTKPPQMIVSRH
jgi:hypothetical protein